MRLACAAVMCCVLLRCSRTAHCIVRRCLCVVAQEAEKAQSSTSSSSSSSHSAPRRSSDNFDKVLSEHNLLMRILLFLEVSVVVCCGVWEGRASLLVESRNNNQAMENLSGSMDTLSSSEWSITMGPIHRVGFCC